MKDIISGITVAIIAMPLSVALVIAKTAANVKNGGRTPVAGMVHSVTLFFVLLFLMPYVSLIPMSTLAAVLLILCTVYSLFGYVIRYR